MKQFTFSLVLFNFLLCMPIFSFAATAEQDKVNYKAGIEILETYNNILNYCNKNDKDINSCLKKLNAQSMDQKPTQNHMNYYCCQNVTGGWGEYAYIHGQAYCVPPC